eukprot:NODE_167_length_16327_cov_0.361597.p3 type:complete len:725 gc:universal NODE_167_length_16327_cov_0.361597:15060-12886(-)
MFLFCIDEKFVMLKDASIVVFKYEKESLIEILKMQLQETIDFAISDLENIYFTCKDRLTLYQFTKSTLSQTRYEYEIKFYSATNGSVLVVLKKGTRFAVIIRSMDFIMEVECGDVPYFFDYNINNVILYFQSKAMILNHEKDVQEIKQVFGLAIRPSVIKYHRGKWYSMNHNSVYVSKSGLEWNVFKLNILTSSFDSFLNFVSNATRNILEYNKHDFAMKDTVFSVCYFSAFDIFLLCDAGIYFYSSGKLKLVYHFGIEMEKLKSLIDIEKKAIEAKSVQLGGFEKRKLLKNIIGDYIPSNISIEKSAKNANIKKFMNLKVFLRTESNFETFENVYCSYIVNSEELETAKISRKVTFRDYQVKMEDFDKSKARMLKRLGKLNFSMKMTYSSPKMTNIISQDTDELLDNEYTKDLLLSQKHLVEKAMKDLEDEGIKQEKLLMCTFEKANNEVISLEYNVERFKLLLEDFLRAFRCLSDFSASKLSSYLVKGRPKFRKSPTNSADNEKGYYDFLDSLMQRFKYCCSKKFEHVEISALDFRFTSEKQEISFFPAEMVIQIQKSIRQLEEQYSCDKEDILGIEHSINIADWEFKILSIYRNSLKSDLMEAASLKPKKEMIKGFESLPKINKEIKPINSTEPRDILLLSWHGKTSTLRKNLDDLNRKKEKYIERSNGAAVIHKPDVNQGAFNDLKQLTSLKAVNFKLLEKQVSKIAALLKLVEKSRPSL